MKGARGVGPRQARGAQATGAAAENPAMEAIFSWVGAALGALFVVAVAVAWWEHLVRRASTKLPPPPSAPRVLSVDVSLDSLAEASLPPASTTPAAIAASAPPPPAGDAAERQAALDGAISRMARPAGTASADPAWTETTPMVLRPLAEADTQPAALAAPDTAEPRHTRA
jgi:hypothetical protein